MRDPDFHGSRVRGDLGATTASTIIGLVVLVVAAGGGWLGYSYYRLLGVKQNVERSLDTVHRFRGAGPVSRARILSSALEKLRAAGGKLEARDISLKLSALTRSNGEQLPRTMRTKLSLKCHFRKLHDARDNRIDRLKRRYADAHRGSRGGSRRMAPPPRPAPTAPVAAPDLGGGLGCSAERLAELDYTFALLTARTKVNSGPFSRTVTVKRAFFLPQPLDAANPAAADHDTDSKDDDEEDE